MSAPCLSTRPGRAARTLLAAALCSSCAPIPERAPSDEALPNVVPGSESEATRTSEAGGLFAYHADARRIDIGERVPDIRLRDSTGSALSLSTFRGTVAVLTFIGASEGNENDAEMLRRLEEIGNAFGPALATKVHLLTLVLDDTARSTAASKAHAAAPPVDVPWTFVDATPGDAGRLASSFGIVVWQYADGSIGHSFNTVIIDPVGRLADQFPGLDPWSPRDVVAAAGVAVGSGW